MDHSTPTLVDAYYRMALDTLKVALDSCRQAGIPLPKMNDVWRSDDVELEGVLVPLGADRTLCCRAARYYGVEHQADAGIEILEKRGNRLDGRAKISVMHEAASGKRLLYAQILPGCRSVEMKELCDRLEIDWTKETKREISETVELAMFLTTAQWAAKQISSDRWQNR